VQSHFVPATLALGPPVERRGWRALWYAWPLRIQLLIVFVLIDLLAVLVAGTVTVLRAREQTRIEISASMRLAELLVRDAVRLAQQEVGAEQFLEALPTQLRSVRHVRIAVKDARGAPIAAPLTPDRQGDDGREPAPAWFAALIAAPIETHEVPVTANGEIIGTVEIIGEPADEIAEVWDNAVAIGMAALLLNAAMVGILYVLFGRVLGPLGVLARKLSDLEQQTHGVRLSQPHTSELAAIARRFNSLALALETARAENLRLNRRLITAQDDERRRTALELHDEVGPCLFGLNANLSSIATAARGLPADRRQSLETRIADIRAIVEHLQAINRSMLDRLRPMALGHVPLRELLSELVGERARQHSEISFSFSAENLRRSYGDSIDLTIYRCIQESLTNVIRHARAERATVDLAEAGEGARLVLTVCDDGCGIRPEQSAGFGIRGMQERVEGLGGKFAFGNGEGGGVRVSVTIPAIEARGAPVDEADALAEAPI
jgi:two-component system, NarL family, sensor histidine kinase UhpB